MRERSYSEHRLSVSPFQRWVVDDVETWEKVSVQWTLSRITFQASHSLSVYAQCCHILDITKAVSRYDVAFTTSRKNKMKTIVIKQQQQHKQPKINLICSVKRDQRINFGDKMLVDFLFCRISFVAFSRSSGHKRTLLTLTLKSSVEVSKTVQTNGFALTSGVQFTSILGRNLLGVFETKKKTICAFDSVNGIFRVGIPCTLVLLLDKHLLAEMILKNGWTPLWCLWIILRFPTIPNMLWNILGLLNKPLILMHT